MFVVRKARVLFFTVFMVGCSRNMASTNVASQPESDGTLAFDSCGEMAEYVRHARASMSYSDSVSTQPARVPYASEQAGPSINTNGQTNLQEAGVDEADEVKVADDAIFVAAHKEVIVLDRASLEERGRLPLEQASSADLYVAGQKLVIVQQQTLRSGVDVSFYRIQTAELPTLISKVSLTGNLSESRLQQGKLLVFVNNWIGEGFSGAESYIAETPCERTIKPRIERDDSFHPGLLNLTTIHAVDIDSDGAQRDSIAVMDQTPVVYATVGKIFLGTGLRGERLQTLIRQIDLDETSGKLRLTASGLIDGAVNNQWAFNFVKEKSTLVVTSSDMQWGSEDNYIQTLRQVNNTLEIDGRLNGFGRGESVKAVRYMNGVAYVVTFKTTDPLFAIDLTDLKQPKLLGELHVPGFSTMLHPLASGRLLGVGFDSDGISGGLIGIEKGIQVSLFDISKPTGLKRLDVKVHGGSGSHSFATSDHRAIMYDAETGMIGLPISETTRNNQADGGISSDKNFSGAVFYRLSQDKLSFQTNITHQDLVSDACDRGHSSSEKSGLQLSSMPVTADIVMELPRLDVRRILKLDGQVLTISQHGLKSHSLDLSQMKKVVKFNECPR